MDCIHTLLQSIKQYLLFVCASANTHCEIAGLIILHQQYLLFVSVLDLAICPAVVPFVLPLVEEHIEIPLTGVPPHTPDQSAPPVVVYEEHLLSTFPKFTHFVTAVAGGIVAAQIRPVINKYFFIFLSPFSFVCE